MTAYWRRPLVIEGDDPDQRSGWRGNAVWTDLVDDTVAPGARSRQYPDAREDVDRSTRDDVHRTELDVRTWLDAVAAEADGIARERGQGRDTEPAISVVTGEVDSSRLGDVGVPRGRARRCQRRARAHANQDCRYGNDAGE
jgi:hypothetical protein